MPLGAARFGLLGGVADLGKLELIETQTITGATAIDFTSISGNSYNVHFVTINNLGYPVASSNPQNFDVQFYESGVLETASVYQYAHQYGTITGAFGEVKSTGDDGILLESVNAQILIDGYLYFYNLNDSSKYSFSTFQVFNKRSSGGNIMRFGSAVLPQASTVDGIRFKTNSTNNFTTGTISLYGIAES